MAIFLKRAYDPPTASDGKRILVEDIVNGDCMSLERWRKEDKPMERVGN